MTDSDVVSRAVVVWTGFGHHAWPLREDQAVLETFGLAGRDLLVNIERLTDDFYSSNARHVAKDLEEMGEIAEAEFRQRHPEISDEAVHALSWCYTFDYK